MSNSHNGQPCPDTYWLPGGKLAAGPYPGFDANVIRTLLDAGIRSFIDLTQEGELESYEDLLNDEAAARNIEVSYSRFAIPDGHAPHIDLMAQILDAIADAHATGMTTYVHCWGGIGRTGTVAGCWLVEKGYSSDEALELVQSLYQKYRTPSAHFPRSPETDAQHNFVRGWIGRTKAPPG